MKNKTKKTMMVLGASLLSTNIVGGLLLNQKEFKNSKALYTKEETKTFYDTKIKPFLGVSDPLTSDFLTTAGGKASASRGGVSNFNRLFKEIYSKNKDLEYYFNYLELYSKYDISFLTEEEKKESLKHFEEVLPSWQLYFDHLKKYDLQQSTDGKIRIAQTGDYLEFKSTSSILNVKEILNKDSRKNILEIQQNITNEDLKKLFIKSFSWVELSALKGLDGSSIKDEDFYGYVLSDYDLYFDCIWDIVLSENIKNITTKEETKKDFKRYFEFFSGKYEDTISNEHITCEEVLNFQTKYNLREKTCHGCVLVPNSKLFDKKYTQRMIDFAEICLKKAEETNSTKDYNIARKYITTLKPVWYQWNTPIYSDDKKELSFLDDARKEFITRLQMITPIKIDTSGIESKLNIIINIINQSNTREKELTSSLNDLNKLQTDIDSLGDDTFTKKYTDIKQQLEDKVTLTHEEEIKKSNELYELANKSQNPKDIQNAIDYVDGMLDNDTKTNLQTKINAITPKTEGSSSTNTEELNKLLQEVETKVKQAETSKKIEDISSARTIVNKLSEGKEKNDFSSRLDAIKIEGTSTSNTTVTGDMDIVVTSNPTIEMTLSTNLLNLDGYDGLEDIETKNAFSIKISSSLPFDLQVQALDDLKNTQGTNIIPIDHLLLKSTDSSDYVTLDKLNKKSLVNGHQHGKDIQFNFDVKLKKDSSIVPDIYKTTLKFETTQK